ncbi:CLE protein [Salix suchowensis]|nr:CLE protein [Salix suchowensis]
MATPKTQSTTAGDHQTCTKSYHFLSLLGFLFIFILLITTSTKPKNPTNMAASIPIRRLLLESSESPSTAMNLHPKQTQDAQFGASAHEVPSGPNPISNR